MGPWSYSLGFTQVFRRDILWFRYLWERSIDCNFPNERLAHDQWVFFLSCVLGKIVYIDQELVDYRQHDNNLYGVEWDISVVNGKKQKQKSSSSWLKSLPYILDKDGERFCTLANIADNRITELGY
jgi:hypothetical protein